MNLFFSILNSLFDLLFWPFRYVSPIWPLLVFSLVTATFMLLVYRYFSNQPAIRRAKDRLGAHLLEVRLFQDQIGVVLRAYGRLLAASGVYLLHSLKPLAVMLVPLVLLMAQMELRLGRAGRVNSPAVLKVVLEPGTPLENVQLKPADNVGITTPALRIPELSEVDWRIEARSTGIFTIMLLVDSERGPKSHFYSGSVYLAGPQTSNFGKWLLFPVQPMLEPPFRAIEILFPARDVSIFGWEMHWLIPFFIFTLLFGYALKGLMGVEF